LIRLERCANDNFTTETQRAQSNCEWTRIDANENNESKSS
jgi:hypothetical protein